MHYFYF